MYMHLKMIFITLILSVITYDSVAQTSPAAGKTLTAIISGQPNEIGRIFFGLIPPIVDEKIVVHNQVNCTLNFTMDIYNVETGRAEGKREEVNLQILAINDFHGSVINFNDHIVSGPATLYLVISQYRQTGPCRTIGNYILEGEDGDTKIQRSEINMNHPHNMWTETHSSIE